MLSIVAGERSNRYVSLTKLTIAYQISCPNSPTIYDWAIAILNGISEQLLEIDQGSHFAYASYIICLLIHQNSRFFKNLTLVKYARNGSLRSVDRSSKEVRSFANYYSFVENFLVLAMSFFAPKILRLSYASKLYLRMPQGEIGDWFFIEEGMILRLYGFLGAPFLFSIHVTD